MNQFPHSFPYHPYNKLTVPTVSKIRIQEKRTNYTELVRFIGKIIGGDLYVTYKDSFGTGYLHAPECFLKEEAKSTYLAKSLQIDR